MISRKRPTQLQITSRSSLLVQLTFSQVPRKWLHNTNQTLSFNTRQETPSFNTIRTRLPPSQTRDQTHQTYGKTAYLHLCVNPCSIDGELISESLNTLHTSTVTTRKMLRFYLSFTAQKSFKILHLLVLLVLRKLDKLDTELDLTVRRACLGGEITGCLSADQPKIISAPVMASNIKVGSISQESEKADYRTGVNTYHMSDKEWISRIYKELQVNNKKPNNPIKDRPRTWTAICSKMTQKRPTSIMKRSLISLMIREMQIKSTRYHLTSAKIAIIKTKQNKK